MKLILINSNRFKWSSFKLETRWTTLWHLIRGEGGRGSGNNSQLFMLQKPEVSVNGYEREPLGLKGFPFFVNAQICVRIFS